MCNFMKKLISDALKIDGSAMKVTLLVSFFYQELIEQLVENVKRTLLENGVELENIKVVEVPGALEMPLAAQFIAQKKQTDVIITLGAVIKGDTAHFDYVCQESYRGLMDVSLKYSLPVIFGVLTVFTLEQALERVTANGLNKGKEFAESALKMVQLKLKDVF